MYKMPLQQAFRLAYDALPTLRNSEGRRVVKNGVASGDLHNDRDIKADIVLGELLLEYFSSLPWCGAVMVEGLDPEFRFTKNKIAPFLVAIDPLDGSLNFEKAKATAGSPYSLAITIAQFTQGEDICFKDIVAAGIMDYRDGANWIADNFERTKVARSLDSKEETAIPLKERVIDLGSQIVVAEFYYPRTRWVATSAFSPGKGYLRSFGSAAYEMACVASGEINAQFSLCQKHHELGAAFRLITNANGFVVNPYHPDERFGEYMWAAYNKTTKTYEWNYQTAVVCAGAKYYGELLVNKLIPSL